VKKQALIRQGIGQGASEMLPFIKNVPLGHGPLKNMGNALNVLVENIQNKQKGKDILFSPNFPYMGWRFYGRKCLLE
jgi:hypothetical protein